MRRMGLILFLLLPVQAEDTREFATVMKACDELIEKYKKSRVLVVLDIDNTLLTMDQDLGGDAWFTWQAGLLKTKPKSDLLVAKDFAGLLRVQGMLFAVGSMHPPEKRMPDDVRRLRESGVTVKALTSRGPEFSNATMRVLKEHSYEFTPGGNRTEIPDIRGLSADEIKRFGMTRRRPILYRHGVYLAAGQHKGAIVRSLWQFKKRSHKAIVFVDDHQKHIDRVRDAFKGTEVELKLFRYSRVDPQVERFKKSDKKEVTAKWRKLREAIRTTVGAGR